MKALVYNGPGKRSWHDVPDPVIQDPEDAIVRVDAVTICGTDLHILKGDVPTVEPGRILGHEAVGTITAVADGVRGVAVGDRVLISCITACGRCEYCRQGHYGQCLGGGGWILGHLIDGTQAEQVRVPFADRSVYKLPDNVSNEEAVLLADILPTSYEVGVLNGGVAPGDTVVIVGAGPIGLAALATSKLFTPARVVVVDAADSRRKAALDRGADLALGPDEDVEGAPATLHLEDLWIRNVTITTGLVDTFSTPRLLSMLAAGRLQLPGLITHRFGLDEMQDAYDVFADPATTGALKVALFGEEGF